MSDLAFADVTRPARCRILKVNLLPYSMGHEIILLNERIFEKLVNHETKITAIIRAVSVCSRNWQSNQKPDHNLGFWIWCNRHSDFDEAIAKFVIHRNEGISIPRLCPGDGKGRPFGASHLTRLFNFAWPMFGESIYDKPVGFLNYLYFANSELAGNCLVENFEEKEVRESEEKHKSDYEQSGPLPGCKF